MQPLSIVQICADEYKEGLNSLANFLGYEGDNLTVKLVNNAGEVFWANHGWWAVEKHAFMHDTTALRTLIPDADYCVECIANLYERVVNTQGLSDSVLAELVADNFRTALTENQLRHVE